MNARIIITLLVVSLAGVASAQTSTPTPTSTSTPTSTETPTSTHTSTQTPTFTSTPLKWRHINRAKIGSGFGNTGIDLESDGDIFTDGDITVTGILSFENTGTQRIWSSTPALHIDGKAGVILFADGTKEWVINAAALFPFGDGTGTFGLNQNRPSTIYTWNLDATGTAIITGLISTGVGLDAIGAVDLDYGSADVTDHTFLTDGVGTDEIVLPLQSIEGAEVLNDTLDFTEFSDSMELDDDTQISLTASSLVFQVANPNAEAFDINGTGNFQSDLAHFHQHNGNPSGPGNILHLESEDEDITPIFHISQSDATLNGPVVGILINISDDDDSQFTPLEYRD
ncbi:hypothetical protein LCGC14_2104700, partial [marine sediment metagenome]